MIIPIYHKRASGAQRNNLWRHIIGRRLLALGIPWAS